MLLTLTDVFDVYPAYLSSGSVQVELIVAETRYGGSQSLVTTGLYKTEMMFGVLCKLTGNVRCASYCCFRVSKPNKKRNPIFKKLLCIFISLLSRLGMTCGYISFNLIFFFS